MAYKFARYGMPHPTMVINPQDPGPVMTVPIVGVPRGGTTMVAAVVDALGIDLGPRKDLAKANTFEDQGMVQADIGLRLSYIHQRNGEREIWGWKYPTAISTTKSLFFALRFPRVIMVFRDVMASVDSEMRFDEVKKTKPARLFSDLMEATLNWWQTNREFVTRTTYPVLLVSYERALQVPDVFVHELGAFLGIEPTHDQLLEALARINPHGGYLQMDEQGHPIAVVKPLPQVVPAVVPVAPKPAPKPAPAPAPAPKPDPKPDPKPAT